MAGMIHVFPESRETLNPLSHSLKSSKKPRNMSGRHGITGQHCWAVLKGARKDERELAKNAETLKLMRIEIGV